MTDHANDASVAALKIDRSSSRRRGARRLRRLALALSALGLLALTAFLLLRRPPEVSVVEVREAQPGEAATALTASGYVAADRRSIVAPKAPGRLEAVLVREGDRVEENQVIARMDPSDARIGVRQAEASVAGARASLRAAEAQALQSQRALDRSQKLFQGGSIARETLLDARAARDASRAQQAAARARLEQAQRGLQAAELRLNDTTIRAPFSGTVVRKLADEGAVLAPATIGTGPNVGGIVELVDLGSLYVQAEVSEDQLARVQTGQPALIFLDAYPEQTFAAVTGTVRPAIDRAKATGTVKVEFTGPPSGLPDMDAKVSFLDRPLDPQALEEESRLRVPAAAVVDRDGKPAVLGVTDEGTIEVIPVEVADRVGNEAALARGPKPGTTIVASPTPRLREGSRVKVRREAS